MILTLDGETNQVNCFDLHGKFLRKFGTIGQGPGEYKTADCILLNRDKSEILLNDFPSHKVNFFNLTGGFLRQSDLKFGGYKMKLINKDLVAIHSGRMGLNQINCELAISDLNGNIRKTYFPFPGPIGGDCCGGFAAGTKLNSILYHKVFDYHIYEVFADRVETLLTLDFGAAAIDTGKYLNSGTYYKLLEEKGKVRGYNSVANTPEHLAANISRDGSISGTWILDHRSKNHQYLAIDTLFSLGNFRGIPVHFPRQTDGSWFISTTEGIDWFESVSKLTEAEKIILRKEVHGFIDAEKVKMDGNPVLVVYRFKDF